MDISLGQHAYEAYCDQTSWRSAVSGDSLPQWADQDERIKAAWEAAASAVAQQVRNPHGV